MILKKFRWFFATIKIEKINDRKQSLNFRREGDAVFIHFPETVRQDRTIEIQIVYSGQPQIPDIPVLTGGIIWYQDKNGKPLVEPVCQGSGTS